MGARAVNDFLELGDIPRCHLPAVHYFLRLGFHEDHGGIDDVVGENVNAR